MSEYQFVHFLAVDRSLDERQLAYMKTQSTRAEISAREFVNEYHFGNFRGDELEMLRRGYDVHLHYANFGIRKLMFRLPDGLTCDKKTFAQFRPKFGVRWHSDKKGVGGILEIQPESDAGTFEEIFDVQDQLELLAPVRELLIAGDLRPLYLAWLAGQEADVAIEPPVPAGLANLPRCLAALAEFYELSEDLLAAAAQTSGPAPAMSDLLETIRDWISKQPVPEVQSLAVRLLSDQAADARADALALIRKSTGQTIWPVAGPTRTMGELRALAEGKAAERKQRKQKAAAAARKKRLSQLAADPKKALAEAKRLVATRSTRHYNLAAQQIADVREALGPVDGPLVASEFAEKIRRDNPKRSGLVAALKSYNLLAVKNGRRPP